MKIKENFIRSLKNRARSYKSLQLLGRRKQRKGRYIAMFFSLRAVSIFNRGRQAAEQWEIRSIVGKGISRVSEE